jgi:hypothetical protein
MTETKWKQKEKFKRFIEVLAKNIPIYHPQESDISIS